MEKMTTRTLPVKLTDDELAIRSQELAEAEIGRQDRTEALESAAEDWKEEKKRLENAETAAVVECGRLARVVKYREEPREVRCAVTVEGGQYIVTRTDTGEVVTQRAATADELQMTLEEAAGEGVDEAVSDALAAARAESEPVPDAAAEEAVDEAPLVPPAPEDEGGPVPQSER